MNFKFTKVVATIGPSSNNYETLEQMILNGLNVVRLNFSHGSFEDHAKTVKMVREIAKKHHKAVAILQDLQGPKIRVKHLSSDFVELKEDADFIITTDEVEGTAEKVGIDYPFLHEEAKAGEHILLDDGLLELKIMKVEGHDIYTKVVVGGKLKPHKGVNLPHTKLDKLPSMTEKDMKDFPFAFEYDLDYVAMSFVRNAKEIENLRKKMMDQFGRTIPIISKIEKPEALKNMDEIVDATDALMVARGDLAIETAIEMVPVEQKKMIMKCVIKGKPVITATHMLDSMINNPRPTRAEASDVANAILDGTSAVMLSAESASGKYPVLAVKTMGTIAKYLESSAYFAMARSRSVFFNVLSESIDQNVEKDPYFSISYAAEEMANRVGAKAVIVGTESGTTTRILSQFHLHVPVLGCTTDIKVYNKMALHWGVFPALVSQTHNVSDMMEELRNKNKHFDHFLKSGDKVVVLTSNMEQKRRTNAIELIVIK